MDGHIIYLRRCVYSDNLAPIFTVSKNIPRDLQPSTNLHSNTISKFIHGACELGNVYYIFAKFGEPGSNTLEVIHFRKKAVIELTGICSFLVIFSTFLGTVENKYPGNKGLSSS